MMYGTRAAAHDQLAEVTRTMKDLGFQQGQASLCVFWHRQRDIKALVHGDDFVSSGERAELGWSCKGPKKKSETDDHGGTGRRRGQGGESVEPNREMAPEKDITYEADPRHADKIIRDTGAENVETISTRGTRPRQRER